jgi:hypothetical protein
MSDRDRLDRIERKINRIGRFVLFGVALLAILVAVSTVQYYDRFIDGYGSMAATIFVVVVLLFLVWARAPFRD